MKKNVQKSLQKFSLKVKILQEDFFRQQKVNFEEKRCLVCLQPCKLPKTLLQLHFYSNFLTSNFNINWSAGCGTLSSLPDKNNSNIHCIHRFFIYLPSDLQTLVWHQPAQTKNFGLRRLTFSQYQRGTHAATLKKTTERCDFQRQCYSNSYTLHVPLPRDLRKKFKMFSLRIIFNVYYN